ncbi:hypothetical protein OIU74_027660 [Salix koriyanagi]|uniref:non-specific serine/threonine protein kinase n=1 Tax=Salix koriyanagi TaxID=2511006 RepID=A0A9Q0VPZ2_9ROSI|nr:hypothetical protein OIU74_027660 [Salix koriyanagi]
MNSSVFSFLSEIFFLLFLFIQIPSSLSNDDLSTACRKEFVCGNISAGFPFWGTGRPPACGIPELELKCENNIARMNITHVAYRVLEINQILKILGIAREDLCQHMNSTFNPKIFEPVEGYRNLTFMYGCKYDPRTAPAFSTFNCETNDFDIGLIGDVDGQSLYIKEGDNGPGECNGSFFVPVSIPDYPSYSYSNMLALPEQLKKGFQVRWKVDMDLCGECSDSSGVCGFDNVTSQATCYYPPGMHSPPEISS